MAWSSRLGVLVVVLALSLSPPLGAGGVSVADAEAFCVQCCLPVLHCDHAVHWVAVRSVCCVWMALDACLRCCVCIVRVLRLRVLYVLFDVL